MKQGYKTTEFWVTLLAMVVGLAVHLGLLAPDTASDIQNQGSSIIVQLFELLAVVVPAAAYTLGRSYVKKA